MIHAKWTRFTVTDKNGKEIDIPLADVKMVRVTPNDAQRLYRAHLQVVIYNMISRIARSNN